MSTQSGEGRSPRGVSGPPPNEGWRVHLSRMDDAERAETGPREAGEERRLARRSAFNFVGLASANALQFGMVWVLARKLGPHDAGVFFEGFAAVRLLSVVAALGLDVTAVRYVATHRAHG